MKIAWIIKSPHRGTWGYAPTVRAAMTRARRALHTVREPTAAYVVIEHADGSLQTIRTLGDPSIRPSDRWRTLDAPMP